MITYMYMYNICDDRVKDSIQRLILQSSIWAIPGLMYDKLLNYMAIATLVAQFIRELAWGPPY